MRIYTQIIHMCRIVYHTHRSFICTVQYSTGMVFMHTLTPSPFPNNIFTFYFSLISHHFKFSLLWLSVFHHIPLTLFTSLSFSLHLSHSHNTLLTLITSFSLSLHPSYSHQTLITLSVLLQLSSLFYQQGGIACKNVV